MAKATITPPPQPPVTLDLTPDEAQTLVDILALVGGMPVTSRRAHAEAIRVALDSAGYHYSGRADDLRDSGTIWFCERA